jgi:hypothetical protein
MGGAAAGTIANFGVSECGVPLKYLQQGLVGIH